MGYKTYTSFGLTTFLVIIVALYLLFTGVSEIIFSVPQHSLFEQTLEKHSMLVGFSRKLARSSGVHSELDFA